MIEKCRRCNRHKRCKKTDRLSCIMDITMLYTKDRKKKLKREIKRITG